MWKTSSCESYDEWDFSGCFSLLSDSFQIYDCTQGLIWKPKIDLFKALEPFKKIK